MFDFFVLGDAIPTPRYDKLCEMHVSGKIMVETSRVYTLGTEYVSTKENT